MSGMSSPRGSGRLRVAVAEEIRVLCARKGVSGSALARAIGRTQSYMSRRLTGEVAFDLDDIQDIAGFFGVDPAALYPSRQDTVQYRQLADRLSTAGSAPHQTQRARPKGRPQTGQASLTAPGPVRPARIARAAA